MIPGSRRAPTTAARRKQSGPSHGDGDNVTSSSCWAHKKKRPVLVGPAVDGRGSDRVIAPELVHGDRVLLVVAAGAIPELHPGAVRPLTPATSRQRFDASFLKLNVSVVPETSVAVQAWSLPPLQSWISIGVPFPVPL